MCDSETLWTIAQQAPLPTGISSQEYQSGLPFPPPGDLPDPGIGPTFLMSPALAARFFITSISWVVFLQTLLKYTQCKMYSGENEETYFLIMESRNFIFWDEEWAAAPAKLFPSCLTLHDPIDSSPPGSSVPGILQARLLEWVAISFSNACMHAKSLQSCPTLCDPMDSSPLGSSVQRILQARILDQVAIFFPGRMGYM